MDAPFTRVAVAPLEELCKIKILLLSCGPSFHYPFLDLQPWRPAFPFPTIPKFNSVVPASSCSLYWASLHNPEHCFVSQTTCEQAFLYISGLILTHWELYQCHSKSWHWTPARSIGPELVSIHLNKDTYLWNLIKVYIQSCFNIPFFFFIIIFYKNRVFLGKLRFLSLFFKGRWPSVN